MQTLETGYDFLLVSNVPLTLGNVAFGQFQMTPQPRSVLRYHERCKIRELSPCLAWRIAANVAKLPALLSKEA